MTFRKTVSDLARFMAKVRTDPSTGCWEWTSEKTPNGYGRFRIGSRIDGSVRKVRAHRWAYESFVGPIPDGLQIDHLCRNRACVNPEHLEPVTASVNVSRGDGPRLLSIRNTEGRAEATHCKRNHPLIGENLYIRPNGSRHCRECARERARAYSTTDHGRALRRRRQSRRG